VLVLGLNYRTAPVGLLERVAVPADYVPKALASIVARQHVAETVVLSTCNRVEVYAAVSRYHGGMADLRSFFSEWAGVAPEDLVDFTYDAYDERAAGHLFAVASGLDSMVVGERQIQLQVKEAFREAEAHGSSGRLLQALFSRALRVGRRARVETGIAAGAQSMVDVGLEAAGRVLRVAGAGTPDAEPADPISGRTVLVVGAGRMGALAARRAAGNCARLLVVNRTAERSARLAERVGGEVLEMGDLQAGLRAADLAISSTGAPAAVVDLPSVAAAMAGREHRPLVLLDLAVPRDVDPACGAVPGVSVLDIDAVRALTDTGRTGEEVGKARALVAQEAAAFAAWTRSVHVEPTIAALRARAERVRLGELRRLGARLGTLDERQRDAVESLTRGIVNTLLHDPTVRLKAIADARGGEQHAAALRELFDLPD
jgi:glutamyl-tRNA reductase